MSDDLKKASDGYRAGGDHWGDCELIDRAISEIESLRGVAEAAAQQVGDNSRPACGASLSRRIDSIRACAPVAVSTVLPGEIEP